MKDNRYGTLRVFYTTFHLLDIQILGVFSLSLTYIKLGSHRIIVSPLSDVLIQGPSLHHVGDGVLVIPHDEMTALDVEWLECETSGRRK
jgi:hypothetical protein